MCRFSDEIQISLFRQNQNAFVGAGLPISKCFSTKDTTMTFLGLEIDTI